MPTTRDRGVSNRDGKPKYERSYGKTEGGVTIWYKEGKTPDEAGFGAVIEGVRRARLMVASAIQVLSQKPRTELAESVLNYHFGGKNESVEDDQLASILNGFKLIRNGLRSQVVICLSKQLGAPRGVTTKQMHLNLGILSDHPDALAHTIIHEASHAFAETDGASMWRDPDGDHSLVTEVYEHDAAYLDLTPDEAMDNADSFAWAALSVHLGRLLTSHDFTFTLGANDTYL